MAQLKSTTITGSVSATGNATIGGDVLLPTGKTLKINDVDVIADKVPISAIVNDLTTGGTEVPLSAEQGKILKTAVDGKVGKFSYSITLPYTSWTGTEAPYSKAVAVSGILATDDFDYSVDFSECEDYDEENEARSNLNIVYKAVSTADTITFYADAVPSADIPLLIKGVR